MTSIRDFGGEFKLIDEITKPGGAVVGVGDDAAVLKYKKDKYLLFTTDMLCEGDHFRRNWSTPYQIGVKSMEANVSDIAAMGGLPTYAVVSISLTNDMTVEYMKQLYRGMYSVAKRYNYKIVGGDTTHSKTMTINVAMLGVVEKKLLSLRSDAKVGDLICVTGDLGKSMAGLKLLLRDVKGDVRAHLMPKCRLHEAREIARYCNAMIDVSDGLASEVNHICSQSNVGAIVYGEKIPISKATSASAKKLGDDPVDYALNGGEDFELTFTVPKEKLGKIEVNCPITVVGEILPKDKGSRISYNRQIKPLTGGFNHFKP
ncbi:MAG: thiamine-phosphate kinase [Candidatus Altiarchaeota archaeon]|nr:thiamine-phosphate kinase [Candidatus Altiarchaeota archaeon]